MARFAPLARLAAVVGISLFHASVALADDPLARFRGGIGSQPLAAAGAPNNVFDVNPGGRPWVIERLSADVQVDGRIRVDGRGLLLAGGNGIGTPGGQTVRARLFCAGVPHDSDETDALDAEGDFRLGGFLTPRPPNPCNTPVLLIVNVPTTAAAPVWFAAGIPKR
ncbi:hypothetical protein EZ313_02455 [Ramlibacter henchirensis]|uniref:Uncharacterized protein n=1 Tax=Ramlibacter henchirensis TaxID=204072 RepID=A0A4Z0C217_9BURK|nr:hypothetical protein [Ramlibacter henchirensis]TFZ05553.1 hypothetical protein EZ313_02455 [Ramlibacter henchirensis]